MEMSPSQFAIYEEECEEGWEEDLDEDTSVLTEFGELWAYEGTELSLSVMNERYRTVKAFD